MATPKKLIIEWTNPAGSGQNDLVTAQLKTDILRAGTDTLIVPPGKVWVVTDAVVGSATVGGRVQIMVNDEPVATTDDVLRYDPSNPSRPTDLVGLFFTGGNTLKANVFVNANGGANPVTESLILYIEEYDEAGFPF